MYRVGWAISVVMLTMSLAACGDDAIEGEATSVVTEAASTTATTVETTTTMPATTTTITTTTTTEPSPEEGFPDPLGLQGFIVGDCHIEKAKVPCDEPHWGEVFAVVEYLGVLGSPIDMDDPNHQAASLALLGDYVGVSGGPENVVGWLDEQGLTVSWREARYPPRSYDPPGLITLTEFSLTAVEGDLTRSYWAG